MITIALTMFKESKALTTSKVMIPRVIDKDKSIFLKNRLIVKDKARNRGIKKENICIEFA